MVELKYNAKVNTDNLNNSHSLAFHFIQDVGRSNLSILEVGCSAGYFGAALKAVGHVVTGVEPDAFSSEQAKGVLDEVFCGFIQDFYRLNPNKKFDVIVFGDVLEHLDDPLSVLILSKGYLNPGGRMVISVPNIAHGCIRAMLMSGDWHYSDLGILDRTHLRFFTKKSLVGLVQQAGLRVRHLQPVKLSIFEAAKMCQLRLDDESLKMAGSVKNDDTIHDFQYVVSVEVGQNSVRELEVLSLKKSLKVTIVTDLPGGNIAKVRLLRPIQGWAWAGGRALRVVSFSDFSIEDADWSDIVVMQRGASRIAKNIADTVSMAGKRLIYDIDDLITEIPDFLGHHFEYVRNKGNIEYCLDKADFVTTTTQRLAGKIKRSGREVVVCPNYASQIRGAVREGAGGAVKNTIILSSSDRVVVDFLFQPLKEIKRLFGDRVDFVFIGPIAEIFKREGIEGECHEIIAYEAFCDLVGSYPNAIGVIPLDHSEFSSCKSAVKYFDYTMAGLPVICSNTPPYNEIIGDDDAILVANDTESWVRGMKRLIDEPMLCQRLVKNSRKKVEEHHGLPAAIVAWDELFNRIAPMDLMNTNVDRSSLLVKTRRSLHGVKMKIKLLNRKRRDKRRQKRMVVG